MSEKDLKIINMQDVEATEVKWLWYPYIPYGKITIIQGDPGEGKKKLHISYPKGSYIQKQMIILANAEEVLTKSLSGDDKKTFLSYANASNDLEGSANKGKADSDQELHVVVSDERMC